MTSLQTATSRKNFCLQFCLLAMMERSISVLGFVRWYSPLILEIILYICANVAGYDALKLARLGIT